MNNTLIKEEVLKDKKRLPVHVHFWDYAFSDSKGKPSHIISERHKTPFYELHTFYKPVSVQLDIKKYG